LRLHRKKPAKISIDASRGLVFNSEEELFQFFQPQIDFFENEFDRYSEKGKKSEPEPVNSEELLDQTLDQPSEIWHDSNTVPDYPVFYFIRPLDESGLIHVAVTYVSEQDEPSFIFLHFFTRSTDLVNQYRRGQIIYDQAYEEVEFGAIEGDAMSEGDPLAVGLFVAMLKLRSDKDISYDKFKDFGDICREETIENPDEIWRNNDLAGNQIVTFLKEFPDLESSGMQYLAVTQEDPASHVHTLLFSFPTNDSQLADRYRHGENLQAEEVSQESSH
jgi:hypothetical protein